MSGALSWEDWNIWGCYHWEAASLTYCLGLNQRLTSAGLPVRQPSPRVASPALGLSRGVGWVLENEPSEESALLFYSIGWSSHGLSQIQGQGAKTPSLKGRSIREFGAIFYTRPNALFGFEVLTPNHSHFEGRGSKTGSTDKDSQPQIPGAPG